MPKCCQSDSQGLETIESREKNRKPMDRCSWNPFNCAGSDSWHTGQHTIIQMPNKATNDLSSLQFFISFVFFFLPQHISSERNDFHQPTKLTHINAKEYDNGNDVQHSPQQQHNDCISVFVSTTTSSQAKNDDYKLEGQQLKRLKQRF